MKIGIWGFFLIPSFHFWWVNLNKNNPHKQKCLGFSILKNVQMSWGQIIEYRWFTALAAWLRSSQLSFMFVVYINLSCSVQPSQLSWIYRLTGPSFFTFFLCFFSLDIHLWCQWQLDIFLCLLLCKINSLLPITLLFIKPFYCLWDIILKFLSICNIF